MSAVAWHDVECGSYAADLGLWDELARRAGGPVLDVGAGTGRVALRLARAGHAVTALDVDGDLLAVLRERAGALGVHVETVVADAAAFDLRGFALVAVPMQTLQLLPDAAARAGFFASAARALAPGGRVVVVLVARLEPFEPSDGDVLPAPDRGREGPYALESQPTAVRDVGGAVRIERLRHRLGPGGERTTEPDAVTLARLDADTVEAEAAAAGLLPAGRRSIPPTADHVGSEVVLLRA